MAYNGIDIQPKHDVGPSSDPNEKTYVIDQSPVDGQWQVEELDGGGVTLHAPAVLSGQEDDGDPDKFYANLADRIDGLESIAVDVVDGVEGDMRSREKFLTTLTEGIDLLGIEIQESSAEAEKSGRGGVSRVSHTVLLEAIVRAQSQARAELLPSEGPVKVVIRNGEDTNLEQMSRDLRDDMNYYLLNVAREYYPDMDRGLFNFFYSGNLFKKVYFHPLRRRPVSECIAAEDLVVSQDAVDLDTALRVTHVGRYTKPQVKRMQAFGGWREIDLSYPMPMKNKLERRQDSAIGVQNQSIRQQDAEYTFFETLVDIDLSEYGIHTPGQPDGLPLPVMVTIERETKQVVGLWRAWDQNDKMFQRKHPYVHYGMVPAFHFLCLGYVHLLGNQAKALRACWRLLLDAGLFSNFPGGFRAQGVRAGTNVGAPAPGEFVELDLGPFDDIRKALLIPPYKAPDPAFIQLCELIGNDAQRLAGAIEFESGEGRTNIPVGTMLAMIEQATQTTAVVHKRMHTAQQREFQLLKQCFADNPSSLWRLNPDPRRMWQTAEEFENLDLVPASDPNVPAQVHRVMLALSLVTMAQQNPQIYDQFAAHMRAWSMIGVKDAEEFLHQPAPQQGAPDPRIAMAQQKAQMDQAKLAQNQQEMQRKAANEALQTQQKDRSDQLETQRHQQEMASKERIAAMEQQTERMRMNVEEGRARRQEVQEAHEAHMDHALDAHKDSMDRQERATDRMAAAQNPMPTGVNPNG